MAAENATPELHDRTGAGVLRFSAALALEEDLSNLDPGRADRHDFDDTCAPSTSPGIGVIDEYRFWYSYAVPAAITVNVYSMPTVVEFDGARRVLEKADAEVSSGEDGIEERFMLSLTPTAEWDEMSVGGSGMTVGAGPVRSLPGE